MLFSHISLAGLIIYALILIDVVHTDIYTSLVQLERLIAAEEKLGHHLDNYIAQEEQRIQRVKKVAEEFRAHSAHARQDAESYLANPLNAFLLIKKFTTDWDKVTQVIRGGKYIEFIQNVTSILELFPKFTDLKGTVHSLMRLQDTYSLSAAQMAGGEVPGVTEVIKLEAKDSYTMGEVAYYDGDYYHAVLWFNQTLHSLRQEGAEPARIAAVLDFLSFALYKQGDTRAALNLTYEWLKIDPTSNRANHNRRGYEKELIGVPDTGAASGITNPRVLTGYYKTQEFSLYERLCRGETVKENPYVKDLRCRYKRDHPYFIIRPLKEEVMYLDPFIAVFHDIIVDSEIKVIKELATPKLHRSGLFHVDAGSEVRTSKSAWLSDIEHPLIARLSYKTEAATGISIKSADAFQVLNYGIGGHYEPHHDYSYDGLGGSAFTKFGNRVSTSLFYMSDVAAGGATVFPELGVSVFPVKGSMTFWYNLHSNGVGDSRTVHAGCPVLAGTKWVCNKWIHVLDQVFRRPCSTDPNK